MSAAVEDSVKLVASLDPQLACIAAGAWGKLDSVSSQNVNQDEYLHLSGFRLGSCVKGTWWRVGR